METILVATDGSPAAAAAVRRAAALAQAEEAELVAVYVVAFDDWRIRRLGPAAAIVRTAFAVSDQDRPLHDAEQVAREYGVPFGALAIGDQNVLTGILDTAKEVEPDLLVIGSDGHAGLLAGHRAGLAETVADKAHCEVLVVRSH